MLIFILFCFVLYNKSNRAVSCTITMLVLSVCCSTAKIDLSLLSFILFSPFFIALSSSYSVFPRCQRDVAFRMWSSSIVWLFWSRPVCQQSDYRLRSIDCCIMRFLLFICVPRTFGEQPMHTCAMSTCWCSGLNVFLPLGYCRLLRPENTHSFTFCIVESCRDLVLISNCQRMKCGLHPR